ncbi:MAG: hypothetical protein ABR548_07065 [Actinomycetota bacterium]
MRSLILSLGVVVMAAGFVAAILGVFAWQWNHATHRRREDAFTPVGLRIERPLPENLRRAMTPLMQLGTVAFLSGVAVLYVLGRG